MNVFSSEPNPYRKLAHSFRNNQTRDKKKLWYSSVSISNWSGWKANNNNFIDRVIVFFKMLCFHFWFRAYRSKSIKKVFFLLFSNKSSHTCACAYAYMYAVVFQIWTKKPWNLFFSFCLFKSSWFFNVGVQNCVLCWMRLSSVFGRTIWKWYIQGPWANY